MVGMLQDPNPFKKLKTLWDTSIAMGFHWENAQQIMDHVISECHEVKEALDNQEPREHLVMELGDLIHCAFSLSMYLGVDPSEAIQGQVVKYERRLMETKRLSELDGYITLEGQPLELKMKYWDQAKKNMG